MKYCSKECERKLWMWDDIYSAFIFLVPIGAILLGVFIYHMWGPEPVETVYVRTPAECRCNCE